MELKFKQLNAGDVECRVAQVSKTGKGCSLLLYKDARCDMRQLDETVGTMNWQRKHEFKDGRLYCSVGIWDEDKQQWIWKEDVGSESNVEKDKGLSSDAFKRAMFNWGCGRELYTAPFIWVKASDVNLSQFNGKWKTNDKFSVKKMNVDSGVITELEIVNDNTRKIVFTYRKNNATTNGNTSRKQSPASNNAAQTASSATMATAPQKKKIFALANEIGMGENELHIAIKTDSVNNLTKEKAQATIDWLERKRKRLGANAEQQKVDGLNQNLV
jgi:Uncharacterized protein conserved in bacteria|nr:MAG TPA: Rad52/22 family double-strand break repair protein [Caudoviricetes sp.]